LLTACNIFGGNQQVKAPKNQQVYTLPEIGTYDFDTLDPALAHDTASINAIQMLFTGLVQFDDHLQIYGQLAQNWQVDPGGTTWTFHLKPHLTFSDGTPLTASDVVYSIDRALQPATQSTIAPLYLGQIKDANQLLAGKISTLIDDSLLAPNPTTVIIITQTKTPYFLSMLTHTCSYIVEKSFVSKYGTGFTDHLAGGGGTGPFTVGTYTHRVELSLVPNAHYYGTRPQLQKVNLVFYPTADQAYQAYQQHKIDTTQVPINAISSAKKRNDFVQTPQLWINYYTMNYLEKPFDNVHIRQAFALAMNKTAIAQNVWKGTVLPTNHIVPQGMNGYNANLTGPDGTNNLTGNASKAQQLFKQGLQEEGWSSSTQIPPITLTYATSVPGFDQEVAALIRTWKTVLNVTVTSNTVDYNTLLDKVTATTGSSSGLQMWGLSWVGEYPDAHDWLTYQFGKGALYNNMNYGENFGGTAAKQQLAQQQLATADGTMDQNTRLQDYQQAEQQLVNDVAWLPMEQVTATMLRNPNIIGIIDNAQNVIPPDDWGNIYRVQ
jgi:peptide/nickel transport system substrate-binding protein/oligopeptide transport system substrate-binding protein